MTDTKGDRAIKAAMGLFLAVMGAIATWVLWHAYQRAEETRHWQPVEAVVIMSQLITNRPSPHSPLGYRAEIHYRYTVGEKTYTGTKVERVEGASNKQDKPMAKVRQFPVGHVITCYVNPDHPETAILQHASRAALYSLWFPLLFVVGGFGMMVSAFLRPKTSPGVTPKSVS
ncbi:DUF3592 domain-containing protein [Verrucomicrobium spinosum]|uniref:DUF3592 domain-containing protein n=1 Tax=Verrucomicrobium spinosum TaxID=2736 RepID=UPI00017452AC|nr:DUF3592 domain-containing protein [Verrucomicrobium spinosum]